MSTSNGQLGNASTLNAAYLSRSVDSNTTGIIGLSNTDPASGDPILNLQASVNDSIDHAVSTESHGATGAVVGTTNTQTLTNKTLEGPAIVTPSRLDVKQDTYANLETYATTADNGQLVFATDTKSMYQIVDGVLTAIGGGGGGSIVPTGLQTIASSGTISATITDGFQMLKVRGNAAGGVTASSAPLGSLSYVDGQKFYLVGQDDDQPLTIPYSDTSKGCLLNGSATLFRGSVLALVYCGTLDRFVEVSRNV